MDLLDKVLTKAAGIPHKPVSMVSVGIGMLVTLFLLAQITWKLVPDTSAPATWRPTPAPTPPASQSNIAEIKELALFGKADVSAGKPRANPVAEIVTDAPKTSLSIQLTGVVASTTEQNGLAVIASGGKQETYGLGDKIKGTSASLKEVFADRIIITNSGRYETLMLDGLEYDTNSQANQQLQDAKSKRNVKKVDQRNNRAISRELDNSRRELLADPSKITDYLAISPVKSGGELAGYRLNPGKDRELFSQAGFKANDLVKSINGYDLTDMGQALEMMAMLPEMTEVSLVVEREGQLVEIMFSLPQ